MPKIDNRIMLWRNTIQLFHKYKHSGFSGPFYESGYRDYRVDMMLLDKTGGELTPDIIAKGPKGLLAVELTDKDKSKGPKLDAYKNIDSRNASVHGWPAFTTPPEIISSRLSFIDDGNHCQIIVKEILDVRKCNFLTDKQLRDSLEQMNGADLRRLPEIPISFVPEMKKGYEIRRGLIDLVLQLFEPGCQGKSAYDMCKDGLERLDGKVSPISVKSLTGKIAEEMDILVKKELSEYLEVKDGRYCAKQNFKEHPKSRESVTRRLQEWANPKNRTLSDYLEKGNV